MSNIDHWQFAELPIRRFTLTWDTGTDPLNADDKVTMLLRQGNQDVAIPLQIVDPAARTVDLDPSNSALNETVGKFTFVIRVTTAAGLSYIHPDPSDEAWTWTTKATPTTSDVADPA